MNKETVQGIYQTTCYIGGLIYLLTRKENVFAEFVMVSIIIIFVGVYLHKKGWM